MRDRKLNIFQNHIAKYVYLRLIRHTITPSVGEMLLCRKTK